MKIIMNKILVIDDDVDILTLVKMTLDVHGFDAEVLSRWENIDMVLKKNEPDLILLDISLCGADGRDICKKLKSQKNTQHIPVILFSANTEMEVSIGDCNAQAFISKPYVLKHFLQTIRSNINNGHTAGGGN